MTVVLANLSEFPTSRLRDMIGEIEVEIIERRGTSDGEGAAAWLVDGNTNNPYAVLKRIIDGIEDGDPEIMDKLPSPTYSGEMADEPTWEKILRDEGIAMDTEQDPTGRRDLQDAYDAAFQQGVESKIREMFKGYGGE